MSKVGWQRNYIYFIFFSSTSSAFSSIVRQRWRLFVWSKIVLLWKFVSAEIFVSVLSPIIIQCSIRYYRYHIDDTKMELSRIALIVWHFSVFFSIIFFIPFFFPSFIIHSIPSENTCNATSFFFFLLISFLCFSVREIDSKRQH